MAKLEQRHQPDTVIRVLLYDYDDQGQQIDYYTGLPLPPPQPGDTVINVTWGDENE